MSCIATSESFVCVVETFTLNIFNVNSDSVKTVEIPRYGEIKDDYIVDISISSSEAYLCAITSLSKKLIIIEISTLNIKRNVDLLRAASKLIFSNDCKNVLVADKTGDVLLYSIEDETCTFVKMFGHLSLLLDILMTSDGRYVITSDRDEKIRVTNYPNTYQIQSYCLGHKEFVKCIQFVPHNTNCLISASGDGTIRIWDFEAGKQKTSVDTNTVLDDSSILTSFVDSLHQDGAHVEALPITQMSACQLTNDTSLVAISLLHYNKIQIYEIVEGIDEMQMNFLCNLEFSSCPSKFIFTKNTLWVCTVGDKYCIQIIKYNKENKYWSKLASKHLEVTNTQKEIHDTILIENIKLLYKRKFDNVLEYKERKKQRIGEKCRN